MSLKRGGASSATAATVSVLFEISVMHLQERLSALY